MSDSILNNIARVGEGPFKLSESILNNIASVCEGPFMLSNSIHDIILLGWVRVPLSCLTVY